MSSLAQTLSDFLGFRMRDARPTQPGLGAP